ncbi:MAG: NAD(P)/FAD-dependent oxidoreductase [Candidatus Abyssubacteria bacterium]
MKLEPEYDIIVVGAGVAGLAAATASARAGACTLVLEAAPEVAMKVKGEVIRRNNTIVERVLRKPLPDSLINGSSKRRRIFSPSCKKHALLDMEYESLMIEYRPFVHELARACVTSGARLALNTVVKDLIFNEREGVCGLACEREGQRERLRCKTVIGADGYASSLRHFARLPAPTLYASYKVVVEGAKIPDDDVLEFMLLTDPAGAIWIFPKGGSSAECGITFWDRRFAVQGADVQAAWERHRENHPILRERLRNASYVLTSKDRIIFDGPVEDFARPGLILVGDAAGHVGAKGGSGILSGMGMGYAAGEFLGAFVVREKRSPDDETMTKCVEALTRTDTWQMLKDEQQKGAMTRDFLFNVLRTNEEIDNAWDALMAMAGKE